MKIELIILGIIIVLALGYFLYKKKKRKDYNDDIYPMW